MENQEIARIFRTIARILEIRGDNVFRIRAYERAAQNIEGLTLDLAALAAEDRLTEIPGIGKDLSEKIKEYVSTGKVAALEELKKEVPEGILELCDIPSVGPKTARLLYEQLGIRSLADLEKAIEAGKLTGLAGIKERTVENIRTGIGILRRGRERLTLAQATGVAEEFLSRLGKLKAVERISVAGSLRRQKETVRDIDILVVSERPQEVMQAFIAVPAVREVLAHGETKSSVRTADDVQVDCRVVEARSYGAALLYFTGSKDFNIKLRQLAIQSGRKINEYGVFSVTGSERLLAGKTEEEIFKLFGLSYIEPEMREDTGEIELSRQHKLPQLITQADLRGDLHAHSTWSDGQNSIEEMARAARGIGYSYIAVTDHSQSLKVARGLSIADLKKKKRQIEQVNAKLTGIRVLFATEADIGNDGGIDYPDEVLRDFDVVVAAIHSGFKQSRETLTRRLVRACSNRYVHIIAHPTGKLWGEREAYELDMEQVFKACSKTGTALEINAYPRRLDLDSRHCRAAKEMGVRFSIGTDSHEASQLEAARFGIAVARRAWLEKDDVLNTLPLDGLLKALKKEQL